MEEKGLFLYLPSSSLLFPPAPPPTHFAFFPFPPFPPPFFCKHRKRIIGQLFQFYTTTTCWYRGRGRLCKPPLLVGCFFGKIPEVVPAVLTGILTGIAQMAPDVL